MTASTASAVAPRVTIERQLICPIAALARASPRARAASPSLLWGEAPISLWRPSRKRAGLRRTCVVLLQITSECRWTGKVPVCSGRLSHGLGGACKSPHRRNG